MRIRAYRCVASCSMGITLHVHVLSTHSHTIRYSFHTKEKNTRKWSCWSIRRLLIVDLETCSSLSKEERTNFFLSMSAIIFAQLLIRQRHSKVMRQPVVIYSSALRHTHTFWLFCSSITRLGIDYASFSSCTIITKSL